MAKPGIVTGDCLIPEKKIYRVLKLIKLLSEERLTLKQIADNLEFNWRTSYRYLNLLQSVGYEIECDFDNRYFITNGCPFCGGTTNNQKHLKTSGSISCLSR